MARRRTPGHSRTVLGDTAVVAVLYISISLASDETLSAITAIVGLIASAIVSAIALWLGLSPYREMYADDPEGKRSRTFKRDVELVNSLWWDAVFYFVAWIVLGIGAVFLLGNMDLLTASQGALLGLFFLMTIPLIALCESGGTAHRHLKATWVEPLREITRKILVYGLCLFGLFVIYGTLNWYEGTWVELLRTKGGILFELAYVAAVSIGLWFGSRATWQKVRTAWAEHDERQEVARKSNRKGRRKADTNMTKARLKSKGQGPEPGVNLAAQNRDWPHPGRRAPNTTNLSSYERQCPISNKPM